MKTRRKFSVLERKNGFDDPGDGRRGVEVAHIGFHRANRAEAVRFLRGPESLRERGNLDGVPQ